MSAAIAFAMPDNEERPYTLETALDHEYMKAVFSPVIRSRFGKNVHIERVSIEVIRRRNHRCVLRYQIHALDTYGAIKIAWRLIGKVIRPEVGQRLYENMQRLWENGFARNAEDGISMPEPLEFLPEMGLLVQEEVPGQPVKALMKQPALQPEHFRQLARTLTKLHKCPIFLGQKSRARVREYLLRCHPRHDFLALACPDLAPAIEYITTAAQSVESSFGDIGLTLLHGDFHLGQVHLQNRRSWLLDFDALGYGDPASDLGNLLVFMEGKARNNAEVQRLIDAFQDEYFSRMDHRIAARIPLYQGLTHLRRACKCLRLQEKGWQEKVQRMVEQGVKSIQSMTKCCFSSMPHSIGGRTNGRDHRIQ
ncbi:MAG: aminoglycoside phosphotransferase family protein [bacterium]